MHIIKRLMLGVGAVSIWLSHVGGHPALIYAQQCGGDCSVGVCQQEVCPTEYSCYNITYNCTQCFGGGCTGVSCPAGQYRPPDGSACRDIVVSCACGEFYACPTDNNPGKQCACCPAEAACRNAKVDCLPGTVRSSTVTSTMCQTVNNEGICGGLGSAQTSAGITATGANCCYGREVDTDNCWIKPSGVEECESEWSIERLTTSNML
jgi:hypothetical protein